MASRNAAKLMGAGEERTGPVDGGATEFLTLLSLMQDRFALRHVILALSPYHGEDEVCGRTMESRCAITAAVRPASASPSVVCDRLRCRVQVRGGLVEDHHARVRQQQPRRVRCSSTPGLVILPQRATIW
jgi:hypothetical protein